MPFTPKFERLPEAVLTPLSGLIAREMGLRFPPERWPDLSRGVARAASELGHSDPESFSAWLLSAVLTRREIETLAGHLTVGETYFFREKRAFEVLETEIVPQWIRSRRGSDRQLRVWSAGCSTGEEPYSLAILLHRLLPKDWSLTILATDINARFLSKAVEGVYGPWSFRESPAGAPESHFERLGDSRFRIHPRLRKGVTFSYLNLAGDIYPSVMSNTHAMDVIFCRNVMMYLTPEAAARAARNFHRCLAKDGWLVVSPVESSYIAGVEFETARFPGVAFYKKKSPASPSVADPMPSRALGLPFAETAETAHPQERKRAVQPDCMLANCQSAQALYDLGQYAEAAELLRFELFRNPEDAQRMALLARACANQGQLIEALAWCDRALVAAKLQPSTHYLRAAILQEQGLLEEAAASFRRVLYLDPDDALAHFALARLNLQKGRLEESEKHFENTLAILSSLPPDAVLEESEGTTTGRLKEAITAFRQAAAGGCRRASGGQAGRSRRALRRRE